MNRAFFRSAERACRGLAPRAALQMCRVMVEPVWYGPLSEEEAALSDRLVEAHAPPDWYHGGGPTLKIGDILLPAKDTGADPRGFKNIVPDRLEHVYITGNKKLAACFAEHTEGNVFRVRPLGKVIVDPTELRTIITFARVLRVEITQEIIRDLAQQNFCCPRAEIIGAEAKFWGWDE